jgi:hypothetical protein
MTRREWRLARQEGRQVSPIQGPGLLHFSKLPGWMERAHRYDISIPEQYARLVAELKTKPEIRRVPFMADALAADFVARPAEFDKLKQLLLDARGDPIAITAALRGAGGYGKTALANAGTAFDPVKVDNLLFDIEAKIVRGQILSGEPRIDGRDTRTVRPIEIRTGLLPRVHGSALFTRGETQALVAVTLGTERDSQRIDALAGEYSEHFMLHYNMPPYATGETGRVGSPKRRENSAIDRPRIATPQTARSRL